MFSTPPHYISSTIIKLREYVADSVKKWNKRYRKRFYLRFIDFIFSNLLVFPSLRITIHLFFIDISLFYGIDFSIIDAE